MQIKNLIKPLNTIITIRNNTTKEIANAIAQIELEQIITTMCCDDIQELE